MERENEDYFAGGVPPPSGHADVILGDRFNEMPVEDRKRWHEDDLDNCAKRAFNEVRAKEEEEREFEGFRTRAKESGTTLPHALRSYVNLEDTLRRDPRAGLLALGSNLGLNPTQMVLMLAPHANTSDGGVASASHEARLLGMDNLVQQARESIPDFDALSGDIVQILESKEFTRTGHPDTDLRHAYEAAKRRREQAVVEKAKAASRSSYGPGFKQHSQREPEPPKQRQYHSRSEQYEEELDADIRAAMQG